MTPKENASAAPDVRARRSARVDPAPLPAAFYARAAEEVARELLGAVLVSEVGGVRVAAEIVETEAYVGPHDEASHAAERFGRTARNDAMFAAAGLAYVYLIYGMHWCLNVVTGEEGFGAAVLVRAGRTIEGIDHARARRAGRPDRDLMRGPGNLARALGVDGALNYHPMDRPPLWIAPGRTIAAADVAVGPRIGISRAADWPLRFWLRGDPHVSGKG
ncbi:MAG TPA: DNA-3-methyladenine glycosylase [Longimicrobium sp.]